MPRVVLFAGPNGSGKSTLTRQIRKQRPDLIPERYVNADEIALTLGIDDGGRAAQKAASNLREEYLRQGVDFAFETVFSHPSKLLEMQSLRAAGYTIQLFFVTIGDVEANVRRVAERVKMGQHDVPVDKIRERYRRVMRLLPRIVEEADEADVYDNSPRDTSEPRLILRKARGRIRSSDPPEYLQRALVLPLQERAQERDLLQSQFPDASGPDESSGQYRGTLLRVGHFLVQETDAERVVHDCLLLPESPPALGSLCHIQYKDGWGTLQT